MLHPSFSSSISITFQLLTYTQKEMSDQLYEHNYKVRDSF